MSFKDRPESLLPSDAASSSARSQVLGPMVTDWEGTMPEHDEGELSPNSERYNDEEEYYSARETSCTPSESEDFHGHGGDSKSQSSEDSFDTPAGIGDEAKSGDGDASQGLDINAVYETVEYNRKMVDAQSIENALKKLRPVSNTNYDTQKRGGCIEGTRTSVLDDLLNWAQDPLAPTIFWLSGMAGTGKTTIAWSFSDRLHSRGLLGGTFFCSRIGPPEHADITRVISTLAYHLAYSSDAYKFAVADQIDGNPDITQKSISKQLDILFQTPFSALSRINAVTPILVIDALDECTDKDAANAMIELLISASSTLPIKFFVTSRPERHIRETQLSHHDYSRVLQLHEVERTVVDHDISIYFTMHLRNVRYTLQDVETLVRLANGLFIFASTSVAYVTRRNSVERLETLTRLAQPTILSTKPLDEMYALIIKEASDDMEDSELASIEQILATILALRARISINGLSEFLGVEPSYLRDALEHLHAVLFVPEQDGETGLSTLHTSFGDFLTSPERAPSHLLIKVSAGHVILARGCFNAIYLGEICSEIVYLKSGYIYASDASDALVYAAKECPYHAEGTGASEWIEAKESLAWRNENSLRTPMEELWQQRQDLADALQCSAIQFNMAKKRERQKETATADETRCRRILAMKCQQILTSIQSPKEFSARLWPQAAVDFTLKAVERGTEHYLLGSESIDNMCAQSQRTVGQIPDGHPDKSRLLNTLSGVLKDLYDSNNTKYHGSLTDALILALRAVALIPDNRENEIFFTESLYWIGKSLTERFDCRYNPEDLERAISVRQRVVDLTPDDHPSKPLCLYNLGTSLSDRFDRVGNLEDIEDAIAAQRRAVDLFPDGHPVKPLSLNNLGKFLSSRFNRVGNLGDIEDAIAISRRTVDFMPGGHPNKPQFLNNLGQSLSMRFNRVGDLQDMEDSIAAQRRAVDLTLDGHPSKPAYLNNLGSSLSSRFDRAGNLGDIEDAIAVQHRTVDLTPDDHPSKPIYLNNLGISLSSRFDWVSNLQDIESAIAVQRRAVNLTPDGHPGKPGYLNNLGKSLSNRYNRVGNLEDIEDAIVTQRRAVDLTPDGHPDKPTRLNNLGTSVSDRFERVGNLEDIEDAIAAKRRAVHLAPDGHPNKPIYLNNLGISLSRRFEWVGDLQDIEDAVAASRRAINLTPDGHVSEPGYLSNLGNCLSMRFIRLGDLQDIEDAIAAKRRAVDLSPVGNLQDIEDAIATCRRAIQLTPDGHLAKPGYINNLGSFLFERFDRVGNPKDIEDAIAAQRRAVDLTPDGHPGKPICLSNLGNSLSRRFEWVGDLEDIEDAVTTNRRAVDLTPDGHPNKSICLNNLGYSLLSRFERLGNLQDIEDAIATIRRAVDMTPDVHPSQPMYHNTLGSSLNSRFKKRNNLHDIEDAIIAYRYAVDHTPDDHRKKSVYTDDLREALNSRAEMLYKHVN